jgi:hypothetical protein
MGPTSEHDEPSRRPAVPPLIVRDADGGAHFELFFISAIATILMLRAFLALAGYPQLGGRGLHIAHAIWGGLGMAAALLLVLVSLNRRAKPVAAIVGGAGFGLFVDEIGKFLTRDNDYFFRPAIALIYVMLVAMFLLVRTRLSARALDPDERLANAASWVAEVALGDLDPKEQERALAFLEPLDSNDPRVLALQVMLAHLDTALAPPPTHYRRFRQWLALRARSVLARRRFSAIMSLVLLLQALSVIVWSGLRAHTWWSQRVPTGGIHLDPGDVDWGRLLAGLVSGAFVITGALQLLRSRERAYRSFRRALHVSLLLTQVFVFYDSQLAGLASLVLNLCLLGAVNYGLHQEQMASVADRDSGGAPAS